MKVLLSIKPNYANKILDGEKLFELRKFIPSKNFNTVVIYSSSPEKKIIGEFKVDGIIHENLDKLWNIVKDKSCVNKKFYDEYFKGRTKGYAIKVKDPIRYKELLPITKYCKRPPLSFMYIED